MLTNGAGSGNIVEHLRDGTARKREPDGKESAEYLEN